MNNARIMFRIYDEEGNFTTVAEDADDLGLVEISQGGYNSWSLVITPSMAEDMRDALDKVLSVIKDKG